METSIREWAHSTEHIRAMVTCPCCNTKQIKDFEALSPAGGGAIPQTRVKCDSCGEKFTINASITADEEKGWE